MPVVRRMVPRLPQAPPRRDADPEWSEMLNALERSVTLNSAERFDSRYIGSLYQDDKEPLKLYGRWKSPEGEKIDVSACLEREFRDGEEIPVLYVKQKGDHQPVQFEKHLRRTFRATWSWRTSYENISVTFIRQGPMDKRNNRVAMVRARVR